MPGIEITETSKKKHLQEKNEGSLNKFSNLLKQDIQLFNNKLSSKKKLNFYNDLHVLLSSGIDIKTAFELLLENVSKKNDQELFIRIKEDIIAGDSLSTSLSKSQKFTMYEIFSVKIGEETGKLNQVLKELADYFTKKIDQKRKIVSAFSYPSIVLLTAIGAIFFMMTFIVPMFEDVFKRFDRDLPALTQFMIDVSHGFSRFFTIFLIIIIGLAITIYIHRKNKTYRKYSTALMLRLPVFGQLIKKINISRFCLGMELLLKSKTPMLNAVQLMQKMVVFYPLEVSLLKIEDDLLHGVTLNESMSNFAIYDKRMISLIKVAEEVNRLDITFGQLKDQYNVEVEFLAGNLNSVMEPLLIIFIGVFVGLILISMYLPMFQMSTGISF